MTLLRQQARQEWLSLLIWSLVMGSLVFYTVFLFQSMSGSLEQLEEMVRQMPESMRGLYGGNVSLKTLSGFLQAYGFGAWIWIPYLIYTAIFAASITTREMDRRTMEFLLSLPVTRWQVILARWGGMALALLVLHAAHLLAVLGGVLAIEEEPTTSLYVWATLNSWLLMLAIGSILLAIGMFIDDYGRAVGVNLGVGLGLFVYHIGTEQAEGALKATRDLLPLAYYDPAQILGMGQVPWADLAILAALALAGLGLSIYLFQRKQIAV